MLSYLTFTMPKQPSPIIVTRRHVSFSDQPLQVQTVVELESYRDLVARVAGFHVRQLQSFFQRAAIALGLLRAIPYIGDFDHSDVVRWRLLRSHRGWLEEATTPEEAVMMAGSCFVLDPARLALLCMDELAGVSVVTVPVSIPATSECGALLWGDAGCALRPPPEVTHVCNVAKMAVPLPALEDNADEEGEWLHPDGRVLRVLQLDLWDDPSMAIGDPVWQRSMQLISRAARWVQAALIGGACPVRPGPFGKTDPCVLVNCHAGRNRSAAVLMARELLFPPNVVDTRDDAKGEHNLQRTECGERWELQAPVSLLSQPKARAALSSVRSLRSLRYDALSNGALAACAAAVGFSTKTEAAAGMGEHEARADSLRALQSVLSTTAGAASDNSAAARRAATGGICELLSAPVQRALRLRAEQAKLALEQQEDEEERCEMTALGDY